jgi:hypothetical protein
LAAWDYRSFATSGADDEDDLVPTQNTPTMQSTLETAVLPAQRTGAYIEGVPRRSACLESATSRNIFII